MEKLDLGQLSFRTKNRDLAKATYQILERERPCTLRQLFYRLISAAAMSNTPQEYSRLKTLTKRLRESGIVPRTWIVDHVRATLKPNSWSGLQSFVESVSKAYRLNYWASLPCYVEILIEKDATAGTVHPVTAEYDVPLRVCRGHASISFAGEIADLWRKCRKPIYAYYLGDFDPSGMDVERDLADKLARYSGRSLCAEDEIPGTDEFAWKRLGVVRKDFDLFDLVPLPLKQSDARTKAFRKIHGSAGAELDALPATELRRRVQRAITSHFDPAAWLRLQEVERLEKESLASFIERFAPGEDAP